MAAAKLRCATLRRNSKLRGRLLDLKVLSSLRKIEVLIQNWAQHFDWADYLASLSQLPRMAAMSLDGGRLAYASAMVLKAQEDKTHPGALIASLSTPWGNTAPADKEVTGYKAVWPRDFYQVASALMALGDRQTPAEALRYLDTVQVTPTTPGNHGASGWFLQKTHVNGALKKRLKLSITSIKVDGVRTCRIEAVQGRGRRWRRSGRLRSLCRLPGRGDGRFSPPSMMTEDAVSPTATCLREVQEAQAVVELSSRLRATQLGRLSVSLCRFRA